MVKFNFSAGGAATTAAAATQATATEMSLAAVAAMDPVPIHPISTRARVHWVFGSQSKYPQFKCILCAPGSNAGEKIFMLAKFNVIPAREVKVDQCVKLLAVEVRQTWKKSNGEIVEAALCPDLAEYELAVNLPMPGKRKRQGAESSLVFLDDDASMPTADFELLPGLAGIALPSPGEGESYISVRVKVVDLSEI
ncbi:unnamed protein product, partial [Cladocopium goreaui]